MLASAIAHYINSGDPFTFPISLSH